MAEKDSSNGEMDSAGAEGGDLTNRIDFFKTSKESSESDPSEEFGFVSGDDDEADAQTEEEDEGQEESDGGEEEDSEEIDESDEEVEGEDEDEESTEDSEEQTEEESESDEEIKKAEVLVGDKTLNIPLKATIPTPVNGKIENPTLQDLRNAYASKASIASEVKESKRLSEQNIFEKRRIEREKQEIAATREQRAQEDEAQKQILMKGDLEELINSLCFKHDVDAAALWDHLDGMLGTYYGGNDKERGWVHLSEAERRALSQTRRASLREKQIENLNKRKQFEEESTRYSEAQRQILDTAKLSMEQVLTAWEKLDEEARTGQMDIEEIKKIKALPPLERFRYAAARAMQENIKSRVEGVVSKTFPKLSNKLKHIVADLESVLGPKYLAKATDENIAELIGRVYNQKITTKNTGGKKVVTTKGLRDKASPRQTIDQATTPKDSTEDFYAQEGGKPSSQVWGVSFDVK